MSDEPPTEFAWPSLPANRTFVVQLRDGTGCEAGRQAQGRIEHLVSGNARRFDNWRDMESFVEQLLDAGGHVAADDGEELPPT